MNNIYRNNVFEDSEVKHNEIRDLIVSRNELVYFLSRCETETPDPDYPSSNKMMKLPDPITRESVCKNCEHNFICAAYYCNSPNHSESIPIQKIGQEVLQHLSKKELDYFFKWTEILLMEEKTINEGIQINSRTNGTILTILKIKIRSLTLSENVLNIFSEQNMHQIWTKSPHERFETASALIDLSLTKVVKKLDGTYVHSFQNKHAFAFENLFEVTQYIIISTTNRVAVASGVIIQHSEDTIDVSIDRYVIFNTLKSHESKCEALTERELFLK